MKQLLIAIFRGYKRYISPLLPPACRYYPTCSSYAVTAVQRYGAGKGLLLAVWRILRCNPLFPGGIDYVPRQEDGETFRDVLRKVRLRQTKEE